MLGCSPKGYGVFSLHGKPERAHRIAWLLTNGDPGDEWVLHHCDNPPCCNPACCFLGDHDANMADQAAKGRAAGWRGLALSREQGTNARLTEEDVAQIRALYTEARVRQVDLAAQFGISQSQVSNLVRGVQWK